MAISKTETKQLLERMIFHDTAPDDWVQDLVKGLYREQLEF
jgi:hypothetical protein